MYAFITENPNSYVCGHSEAHLVIAWACCWQTLRTCKSVGIGKGNFSWHSYHYISHACLVSKRLIQRKQQFWCPAGLESVRHEVSP